MVPLLRQAGPGNRDSQGFGALSEPSGQAGAPAQCGAAGGQPEFKLLDTAWQARSHWDHGHGDFNLSPFGRDHRVAVTLLQLEGGPDSKLNLP